MRRTASAPDGSIIQGPFEAGDKRDSVTAKVDAPDAKGLEAVVTVDLDAQKVKYVANGVELKAKLKSPLSEITHVGYLQTGALIDVSDVKIERQGERVVIVLVLVIESV